MKFSISIIIILLLGLSTLSQTNFRELSNTSFTGVNQVATDMADVDSDGDLDILYCGKTNTTASITLLYLNDGYANFSLDTRNSFPALYAGAIRFSDIDNDGDQDFLIFGLDDSNNEHLDFYLNDGSGVYSKKSHTNLPQLKWMKFEFGDVDGDNHEDLILNGFDSTNTPQTLLFINDGLGDYHQDTLQLPANYVQYVRLIDLDNDNDLDLFIKESYNITIYENNGLGNFTVKTIPNIPTNRGSYSIGDFDNDSLLDITVSGYLRNGLVTTTYLNQGAFVFKEGKFGASGFESPVIYFKDVNVDGYNDMVLHGRFRYDKEVQTHVYYGNGTDYMQGDWDANIPLIELGSIIFTDLDNDTDPDFIMIGIEDQNFMGKILLNDVIISTEEIQGENNSVNIFPNPFKNSLQLDFNTNESRLIEIYTVTGSLVYTLPNSTSNTVNIYLPTPPGVYIIRITSISNSTQYKIIKE